MLFRCNLIWRRSKPLELINSLHFWQRKDLLVTFLIDFYLHAINLNAAKKALQFSDAQIWIGLQSNCEDLSFPKFKEAVKADLILKYK